MGILQPRKALVGTVLFGLILSGLIFLKGFSSSSGDQGTIYFGGEILTMAEPGTAQAVLTRNGQILAVGSEAEIFSLKAAGTRMVDLGGRTLMPGFIAVHTHPDLSAYLHGFVDLSGFTNKSAQEVWNRLKEAVEKTPKGEWIFCKGFDPMLVKGLKAPDIGQLDAMAPDHPLVILAQSLHSAWANSLAFSQAGVTADTPAPAPGSYWEKDAKGRLTGFIAENEAMAPFSKIGVTKFDLAQNAVRVQEAYAKSGFTAITTMGLYARDKKPFLLYEHLSTAHPGLVHRVLDLVGLLPDREPSVRHFVYLRHDTPFLFPEKVENGDDFFRVLGLKLWYDGSPYTGSMYLKAPYMNSRLMQEGLNIPHNHQGKPVMEKETFSRMVKTFHDMGWQLSIHSQGDQATAEVLEVMEQVASGTSPRGARHRLEHGVLLPPELLGKMKTLNMTPSFHVNHLLYYGDALQGQILGQERAQKMLPVKSAFEAGLHPTLHADAPMYPENPFDLLQTAVTRKTRSGAVMGAHERISVEEGLRALTFNAAFQLGMEDRLGSIEPGKYADFVVLDQNPLKVPEERLGQIQVLETIVNGRRI